MFAWYTFLTNEFTLTSWYLGDAHFGLSHQSFTIAFPQQFILMFYEMSYKLVKILTKVDFEKHIHTLRNQFRKKSFTLFTTEFICNVKSTL